VKFDDGDVQETKIPDKDVEVVQGQVHAAGKVCKIEGCYVLISRSAKRKAPAKGTPGAAATQGKILEYFAGSASAPGRKRRRGEQVKEGASAGAGKAAKEETKDGKKRKNEDDTPSKGKTKELKGLEASDNLGVKHPQNCLNQGHQNATACSSAARLVRSGLR
jgi:hypothetical protein